MALGKIAGSFHLLEHPKTTWGGKKGLWSKGSCPASFVLLPEAGEQLPTGPTGQRGDSAAPARTRAQLCGEV